MADAKAFHVYLFCLWTISDFLTARFSEDKKYDIFSNRFRLKVYIPLLIISKFIVIYSGILHRNAGSALLQFKNAITAISYFLEINSLLELHINTISTVCITKCKKNMVVLSLLNFIMTDTLVENLYLTSTGSISLLVHVTFMD
ncbi:Glutathione synthetase, chloroplastic [Frankliniella fusca]|uniref:Glutathione synthetase, chloroplastic n=1 Tax=Frankliniella fusca TaxID=407009 RepID=A0AAE1IYR4_9NEOP|nr:Glutathione synthetase, chloroplastic [Frankliniella fusca]